MNRLAGVLSVIVATVLLASAKDETCYSIQLASAPVKKTALLNVKNYPNECQLISLSNLKAIRCGCFDEKTEVTLAKEKLKQVQKKYPNAILLKNKKSRYKEQVFFESKPAEPIVSGDGNSSVDWISNLVENVRATTNELMIKGNVGLEYQNYLQHPDGKNGSNLTASAQFEMNYKKDNFEFIGSMYGQADYSDLQGEAKKNNRSFIRLDELYGKYNFEDSQILVGKNIRYWGALEARNIVNTFNNDDLRADPFDSQKLGSWNAAYSYFTKTGEFSIIAKLYEEDRTMAGYPYVYNFFPKDFAGIPLEYNENLITEKSPSRPTVYLKYSDTADTKYALDYAIIFQNGYDSQRYYTDVLAADLSSIVSYENAYLVNKVLTYETLAVDATLYKLEAIYADVIDNAVVSDYYHLGVGLEHTISQIHGDEDLGLIVEYYKYDTFNKSKYNDLTLFEAYQNDLFVGTRYSFNDVENSSIVGGAIIDLDYNEQLYYVKYSGRIFDGLTLNVDYRFINPSSDTKTVFNLIEQHQRMSVRLGYYF